VQNNNKIEIVWIFIVNKRHIVVGQGIANMMRIVAASSFNDTDPEVVCREAVTAIDVIKRAHCSKFSNYVMKNRAHVNTPLT
jgi:hypothetical protein